MFELPARAGGVAGGCAAAVRVERTVVLRGVFADGLAAQRFLVAHVPVGGQLPQRAGDHVLGGTRGPDRLHQQRRHEHVAAEIGREVGQPRHELLPVAEELDAAQLPLEPPVAQRVSRVRSDGVDEPPKVVAEELVPRERRQGRRIGRHAYRHANGPPRAGPDGERASGRRQRRGRLAGIALQREPQVVGPTEARLLDGHDPRGVALAHGDPRLEPPAQVVYSRGAEQRQLATALGALEALQVVDELEQLGLWKRRRVERQGVAALILEVALHAHRAEQEQPDGEWGRGPASSAPPRAFQAVGHGAGPARRGDSGADRRPGERGGPARRVARREAHALVGGVRPEVHNAPGAAVQRDLEGVAVRVAIQTRRVALIRGGIVEPRLGEGEIGRDGIAAQRDLRGQDESEDAHFGTKRTAWKVFPPLEARALDERAGPRPC